MTETTTNMGDAIQAAARAYWEGRYGSLGDSLDIDDRPTHKPDGWHVSAYIASFGFVHCIVYEDGTVGDDYDAADRCNRRFMRI